MATDSRGREYVGIRVSMHPRTRDEFRSRLGMQGASMQAFFAAMVDAYLKGHAAVGSILEQWIRSEEAPRRRGSFTMTKSELDKIRKELYDEGEGEI